MDRDGFDRLARSFGRAASRRAAFVLVGSAVATALASERAEAAAFDRSCDRFVIAARNRKKFEHVDDNLLVELQAKGGRRWKTVWDDRTDDDVNFNGQPFRIEPFRARIGDKIRISAYNLGGACDLDEIWLFCADGRGTGKRVLSRYGEDASCAPGKFLEETFRIKP